MRSRVTENDRPRFFQSFCGHHVIDHNRQLAFMFTHEDPRRTAADRIDMVGHGAEVVGIYFRFGIHALVEKELCLVTLKPRVLNDFGMLSRVVGFQMQGVSNAGQSGSTENERYREEEKFLHGAPATHWGPSHP